MPLTRAQISQRQRDKKRKAGLEKIESWVVDNEEAKQLLKDYVVHLNKRYNCFKFKGE